MRNCPNCGAPIDRYKCKCEYCGTWIFNFAAFDVKDGNPCYVRFRTDYGDLMMLAKPEITTIESKAETVNAYGGMGGADRLATFVTGYNIDLDVTFHAIADKDGTLFKNVYVQQRPRMGFDQMIL